MSLTPFLGKSHLAPVHAMLHVESLSISARVLQTERTTDSPILSLNCLRRIARVAHGAHRPGGSLEIPTAGGST